MRVGIDRRGKVFSRKLFGGAFLICRRGGCLFFYGENGDGFIG